MTVHDLHDALNYLPFDLLTAADAVRTVPKARVIPWKRIAAMAAVLVLVVGTTLVFGREIYPYLGDAKMESAAQAPAAAAPMAPAPVEDEVAADEVIPEEPAAEAPKESASTTNGTAMGGDEKGMEEELLIDHSHRFAETEETVEDPVKGFCGNMTVVIDVAGERHTISGSDAVAITDILINLDYDPEQVCRCMTDITVDTETLTGIRLNLTEAFARCEQGQAALTREQVQILQEIIDHLE